MAEYKTRPAAAGDPGRKRTPSEQLIKDQGIAAGGVAPTTATRTRPSRTPAWVMIPLGLVLLLLGVTLLFGTSAISGWILGAALMTIGAVAVIVGSALLAVLGAL